MVRQGYSPAAAIMDGHLIEDRIILGPRPGRWRRLARGSLRTALVLLKVLVVIPLALAVAVTVWIVTSLLRA